MYNNKDISNALLNEFRIFFEPISFFVNFDFPHSVVSYFNHLNIDLSEVLIEFDEFNPESELLDLFLEIENVLKEVSLILDDEHLSHDDFLSICSKIKQIVNNISQIHERPIFIDSVELAGSNIGVKIFHNFLYQYLKRRNRLVLDLLFLLGLVSEDNGCVCFNFEEVNDFLSNPIDFIGNSVGWGGENFNPYNLLYDLQSVFNAVKIFPYFFQSFSYQLNIMGGENGVDDFIEDEFDASDFLENEFGESDFMEDRFVSGNIGGQFIIPFAKCLFDGKYHEIGISILPKIYSRVISEVGIFIFGIGKINREIRFDNNWKFTFESDLESTDDFGLLINSGGVTAKSIDNTSIPNLEFAFGIDKTLGFHEEVSILNILGSSLTMKGYALKLKGELKEGEFEPTIESKFKGMKFHLQNGSDDGFLSKIIPSEGTGAEFDLTVGWAKSKGLYFKGASALEISIPLDTSSNKHFELKSIDLLVKAAADNGILLQATTSGSVKFGPFHAFVEKVGVKSEFTFPQDGSGNLGLFNADIGFKRPSGIGLDIDAKGITGGGILFIEEDRYAGILSLNAKAIDLTAIGILNTKLPNNKPGFSLLVSISVLFDPAIELGMGFRLGGVGGLLGVHRTYKVEAMRERLVSGSINSIMFPEDPIKNAASIISDLRAVFPPLEKHYVIAPFLRLLWGNMIKLDLGVLFELPFNDRIILLGSIGIIAPEKKPRLVINIDVLGDFNFAEKYIRVEGVLRDSHINNDIPIKGGFAFMTSWGNQPQFLFSVGGYHPRYKKPAQFPDVARVGAVIKKDKNLTLTVELYTAITSNSFQIGFRADLHAKFSGVSATGYLGFDVLIYFNPFRFDAYVEMGVSIKYKSFKLAGASLEFRLTGPGPWNAIGTAHFSVLGKDFSKDFDFTWGKRITEPRPIVDIASLLQYLEASLLQPSNWSAKKPEYVNSVETFRTIEDESAELLLNPSGYLEVRQQVIPLGRSIEKYGENRILGRPKFSLSVESSVGKSVLKEYFSRGQFEHMTDEEKLSSPDFELMNAGYRFGIDSEKDFKIGIEDLKAVDSYIYEEKTLEMEGEGHRSAGSRMSGEPPSETEKSDEALFVTKNSKSKMKKQGAADSVQFGGKEKGKPVILIPGKGGSPIKEIPTQTGQLPTNPIKKEPIKRTWKDSRGLLNKSRRNRSFFERREHELMLKEEVPSFREADEFVVAFSGLSSLQTEQVKFSTFSEAKEYMNQHVENIEKAEVVSFEALKELSFELQP